MMRLALKIASCLRALARVLQFSRASHESQNCLRSEQNQTFYESVKNGKLMDCPLALIWFLGCEVFVNRKRLPGSLPKLILIFLR